ncbi:hypothetical protein GCM10027447_30400 [Glycomyces halotolerans]
MTAQLIHLHQTPVLLFDPDGEALGRSGEEATDLIGAAFEHQAEWLAVPAARLDEAFFDLRTGVFGDIAQKCANYKVGLAVVGDVASRAAASDSLRALVAESNRGRAVWFTPDLAALENRLAPSGAA